MILSALILIPFIGGLLCWLGEKLGLGFPRWIALISMAAVFGLGLYLWAHGDYSLANTAVGSAPNWQLEERYTWIPHLGVSIHLALDGLSLLMVLLTGLLGIMAIGCSWSEIQRHVGFFHLNLLWSLGGVIGVVLDAQGPPRRSLGRGKREGPSQSVRSTNFVDGRERSCCRRGGPVCGRVGVSWVWRGVGPVGVGAFPADPDQWWAGVGGPAAGSMPGMQGNTRVVAADVFVAPT